MLVAPTDDRLRAPDWRDKYRWPDPDQGWSGPLAGYPPDHPIRAGRPIPLHLIAKRYQQDDEVTRYQAMGLIGAHIPEKRTQGSGPAGGDTPSLPLLNTPAEKARKLAIADALGIERASSLLAGSVLESPIVGTDVPVKRGPGRPKSGTVLSEAERKRLYRARKKALLSGGAHVLGIGSHKLGRDS
jgi:hypothetical protein